MIAKEREFADEGVPVRTVTVIVSDGADQHSRKRPGDVARPVDRGGGAVEPLRLVGVRGSKDDEPVRGVVLGQGVIDLA